MAPGMKRVQLLVIAALVFTLSACMSRAPDGADSSSAPPRQALLKEFKVGKADEEIDWEEELADLLSGKKPSSSVPTLQEEVGHAQERADTIRKCAESPLDPKRYRQEVREGKVNFRMAHLLAWVFCQALRNNDRNECSQLDQIQPGKNISRSCIWWFVYWKGLVQADPLSLDCSEAGIGRLLHVDQNPGQAMRAPYAIHVCRAIREGSAGACADGLEEAGRLSRADREICDLLFHMARAFRQMDKKRASTLPFYNLYGKPEEANYSYLHRFTVAARASYDDHTCSDLFDQVLKKEYCLTQSDWSTLTESYEDQSPGRKTNQGKEPPGAW